MIKLIAALFTAALLSLASFCSAVVQALLYLVVFVGLWWLFACHKDAQQPD